MPTEQPHAAYARSLDQLDIVAIDDSKPMQSILRSILHSLKVARIRTYDGAQAAMDAMLVDPPNLVIVDWIMDPIDGLSMLKAMRTRRMGGLAVVPALILTGQPTVRLVEASIKVGAHSVLAKPISPSTLQRRIEAIIADKRTFSLDETSDSWVLEGARELLDAQRSRQKRYRQARDEYIEVAKRHSTAILPADIKPVAAAAPVPPSPATTDAKPKQKRKAVGFGARRIDPLPAPPPVQT